MFPIQLQEALIVGSWADPGSEALKNLLGLDKAESDLTLFGSRQMMERVAADLDAGGYVDDPEFCMVRRSGDRGGPADPRLVYSDALFVGGSKFPGDDVFLAIDTSKLEHEQSIIWFDWSRSPPERWTPLVSLPVFLERLRELFDGPFGGRDRE